MYIYDYTFSFIVLLLIVLVYPVDYCQLSLLFYNFGHVFHLI